MYVNRDVRNVCFTFACEQGSWCEKEEVDVGLLPLNFAANIVDVLQQGQVALDEAVFPARVKRGQLGREASGGLLGAAEEVDPRLDGVLDELAHGGLADAAGAAGEDCHHACRKALGDAAVGGPHLLEGDHIEMGRSRVVGDLRVRTSTPGSWPAGSAGQGSFRLGRRAVDERSSHSWGGSTQGQRG